MPLTPRFVLSQTTDAVTVTIRTPHVRVSASSLEVVIDGDVFHFYSPPCLLRLTLPGRLVDDAESGREARVIYDPSRDNGTVTVTVHKDLQDVGIWDGLDLVGRLMVTGQQQHPQGRSSDDTGPAIEVLSSKDNEIMGEGAEQQEFASAAANATAPENAASDLLNLTAPRYGFLNLYHSMFVDLAREGLCQEMIELPEPDTTLAEERRSMRLDVEADKFDPDRYLGDAVLGVLDPEDNDGGGDMIFDEAVSMVPHWIKGKGETTRCDKGSESSLQEVTSNIGSLSISQGDQNGNDKPASAASSSACLSQLTPDEIHSLASVPSSHAPPIDFATMSHAQIHSTLLSILDVLFGYAYDHRTTGGDPTVESSWTIAILSPTLSWFECYHGVADDTDIATSTCIDTPSDVLTWCIRRSIIYPYLRSYNLGAMVAADAVSIIQGGRRMILRCLVQLRNVFENSTGHYLLNKLYIDPFIFWLQTAQEEVVEAFAAGLEDLAVDIKSNSSLWKTRIGLDLIRLEAAESDESIESEDDRSDNTSSAEEKSLDNQSSGDESTRDSSEVSSQKTKISLELLRIGDELNAVDENTQQGSVPVVDFHGAKEKDCKTGSKPLIQEL